ncbi:MAG: formate dehydrogenase subunit gamma [Beijerinckiaceae bacterium]|nr:formate dehydrogenase subunit gamma [Beijerinckiaceae bacterium]
MTKTKESTPMKTAILALRALVFAMALAVIGHTAPVFAQQAPNPTAQSVNEQQLLDALRVGGVLDGRITIPNETAKVLIQPRGKDWRDFHQTTLWTIGGVSILGMLGLLVVFFLVRGKIRIESGFSGRTVTRFGGVERFVHWLTAGCFIILALSGLNLTFGKAFVAPVLGESAFALLAGWGKFAHNYLSFPFMFGLVMMFVIWVKDNIPGKLDLEWLKAGGGILKKGQHPPAPRFNAGQKGIFWIVILGGAAMSVSGWHLLFPFGAGSTVSDQQFWANVHAVVAMVFIAVMLAHAYIGSVGMEGAYDAMGSGEVDENWAREHHSLWLAQEEKRAAMAPPLSVPAE